MSSDNAGISELKVSCLLSIREVARAGVYLMYGVLPGMWYFAPGSK